MSPAIRPLTQLTARVCSSLPCFDFGCVLSRPLLCLYHIHSCLSPSSFISSVPFLSVHFSVPVLSVVMSVLFVVTFKEFQFTFQPRSGFPAGAHRYYFYFFLPRSASSRNSFCVIFLTNRFRDSR